MLVHQLYQLKSADSRQLRRKTSSKLTGSVNQSTQEGTQENCNLPTENGTNKLPDVFGTIKSPERQINGSSYKNEGKLLKRVAGHTGQSSQLFPVATGRNA